MARYRVVVALTPDEIAEARQIRDRVYREEEGLWAAGQDGALASAPESRSDPCDSAAKTALLVAYAGSEAVGTIRVSSLAPSATTSLPAGAAAGLVERFCVLRRFRGTAVVAALYDALRSESRRRGLTHWVAAANTETDCQQEAALIYRAAAAQGLVRESRDSAVPWPTVAPPECVRHVYTPAQRRQAAAHGTVAALPLPRTLALFAKRMSARYVGPPFFDRAFRVFALPLVAPV
jgi:hypothetical protein